MIKKILKWAGIVVGSLVSLLILFFVAAYFISESQFYGKRAVTGHAIALLSDSASIARGEHIALAFTKCQECHGENFGGKMYIKAAAFGEVVAPNITRGGVTANFSGQDWERAVRHGVAPDGRPLRFMPASGFHDLSDDELQCIVAYIRHLPPVMRPAPESSYGWLLRGLMVAGILPIFEADMIRDHNAAHIAGVTPGVNAIYGKHLADASGCTSCHGEHLSGGPLPGAPPSIPVPQNITPEETTGIGKWTFADFKRALREGKRPNGDTINTFMPWKYIGKLHDEEIEALWLYLRSVPSAKFGNR